ncbi:MAG: hypothetical protein U5M51_12555 [Emticicia sp.]|nr:hypothetical protein [Emticicia sp.]
MGSSTAFFTIPESSTIAKNLLAKYTFTNNQREVSNIGGTKMITEKVGIVPLIKIGNLEFKDIKIAINSTKNIRIGNDFFKGYLLYIDNTNGDYKVLKRQ